jgi:AcrR family transcriptional regulator
MPRRSSPPRPDISGTRSSPAAVPGSSPGAATPERAYHHGDLRSALVAEARRILVEEGLAALTLRAVARAAGVSQTAPYRHFADRRSLVAAVAAEGFEELAAAMAAAMASGGGRQGFKGVAHAYVRFGQQHPALYRVMFGPEVADTGDLPELATAGRSALDFVRGGIEQLQAHGLVKPGDAALMAVTAWAALHGITSLILDGQAETVADADAAVEAMAQLVMFGLAPRLPG